MMHVCNLLKKTKSFKVLNISKHVNLKKESRKSAFWKLITT